MMREDRLKSKQAKIFAQKVNQRVGRLIQKYRKKNDYTLDNLSKISGISPSTISRYENGKRGIPVPVMAYMSSFFDYDMTEYVMDKNAGKSLCSMFKELVGYGEAEIERLFLKNNPPNSKCDKRKNKHHERNKKSPTELEDVQFEIYLKDENHANKQALLCLTYALFIGKQMGRSKDLQIAARAISRYIASDEDTSQNRVLKAYLEKCRSITDENT